MMILPPQVNTAISMLYAAGYEAFLVGGAVRDYVRDNSPAKDWDITTNALPAQVESVFSGYHLIETGLKHGTVTVMIDHEPIEITTYRIDGDYSDHRHPDSVHFTRSLKEDLERRDFTMNALAYSPQEGIVDLVGGRKDIEDGIVRCVGDPNRRFQEDGFACCEPFALRPYTVWRLKPKLLPRSIATRNYSKALPLSVFRLNSPRCSAEKALRRSLRNLQM